MDAGLKTAAASEGVAGSDEDDIEPAHLTRDLILDPAGQVTPDLRASAPRPNETACFGVLRLSILYGSQARVPGTRGKREWGAIPQRPTPL
jgi:hypothetical protein